MHNYSALNYNLQVFNRAVEICSPLFSYSCVKSFRYFRIFENGDYINISTNQEWLNERVTKIHNNSTVFQKSACSAVDNKMSFYLWPTDCRDAVLDLFKKHNIFHGITAYKRSGSSVEAWSFGATVADSQAANFYINNLDILNKFISYFNICAKELIDVTDSSKLAHFSNPISIEKFQQPSAESFPTTGFSSPCGKKNLLTNRQLECLKLISNGRTAREVARIMNVSSRTVESHINTIKDKLKTTRKNSIIEYYWKYIYPDIASSRDNV